MSFFKDVVYLNASETKRAPSFPKSLLRRFRTKRLLQYFSETARNLDCLMENLSRINSISSSLSFSRTE